MEYPLILKIKTLDIENTEILSLMNLELHHFFILLRSTSTVADLLSSLGMHESIHRQQHEELRNRKSKFRFFK